MIHKHLPQLCMNLLEGPDLFGVGLALGIPTEPEPKTQGLNYNDEHKDNI